MVASSVESGSTFLLVTQSFKAAIVSLLGLAFLIEDRSASPTSVWLVVMTFLWKTKMGKI